MSATTRGERADLVGCDLEYAVMDDKEHFIPAGLLPINGTKGFPDPYQTGGIEIDCTAVELTFPPAATADAWVENILRHLNFARDKYRSFGKLVTKPSVFFEESVLKRTRFADMMGCSPDYNAWTGEQNPLPIPHKNLRAYGGHVHIANGSVNTVKACDLTLGMWTTIKDSDTDRRKMYGKAGAYRMKPYGVEYRVMSNHWCDNENDLRQVWDLVQLARRIAPKVDTLVETFGGPVEIQGIINFNAKMKARNILKSVGYTRGAI
jgi:hypothetical protein